MIVLNPLDFYQDVFESWQVDKLWEILLNRCGMFTLVTRCDGCISCRGSALCLQDLDYKLINRLWAQGVEDL